MGYQHDAQLANIVTSYATCLAGIMPLLFTSLTGKQPGRWYFAYFCILLTGIPTVGLHAMEGNRVASFLDVGSNIFLAWALQVAISGDFMGRTSRFRFLIVSTVLNLGVEAWLIYEIFAPEKIPLVRFGDFGQFYTGEVALIINSWIATGLLFLNLKRIPAQARSVFYLMCVMFLIGMFMATAKNSEVSFYIFPWHALWHLVGAFGFIAMWLMNYLRFVVVPLEERARRAADAS